MHTLNMQLFINWACRTVLKEERGHLFQAFLEIHCNLKHFFLSIYFSLMRPRLTSDTELRFRVGDSLVIVAFTKVLVLKNGFLVELLPLYISKSILWWLKIPKTWTVSGPITAETDIVSFLSLTQLKSNSRVLSMTLLFLHVVDSTETLFTLTNCSHNTEWSHSEFFCFCSGFIF